jgi:predicted metal-dependent peptidase
MKVEEELNREIAAKMRRARTSLLLSNGFFGYLALQLELRQAHILPNGQINLTMATDGRSIYYNPEFVKAISNFETEGVIVHEVYHCCLRHFARIGRRNPIIWNFAGDHVINLDLKECGFQLPGDPPCDPKYANMNTEQVYDLLEQDPQMQKMMKMFGEGGGKGEQGSDPGGCGGVFENPNDSGEKQDELKNNWETAVRMAIEVAKQKSIGNIPGTLRRLIDDLMKPKISWRDLTRRFIDQSMTKDVSWARPNRRSVGAGVLMPGLISDRLHHLVMLIDVSGSVDHAMMREFISEVAGALDEGTADKISVVYADTHVHHVDEFVVGDIVTCSSVGGGGTDFRDSFRWVAENAADASCVIYLTDLEVHDFGDDPGVPVLWAVYGAGDRFRYLASKAPFGECLEVNRH